MFYKLNLLKRYFGLVSNPSPLLSGIILANDLSGGVSGGQGPGSDGQGTQTSTGQSGNQTHQILGQSGVLSSISALSLEHQQFNIFPAIFSRQLNFSAANCAQNKLMNELRRTLGLLSVNLMENEAFHLNHNHNSEKRKCSSASSNEQDFGLYGVHQVLEGPSPTTTPVSTPGRNVVQVSPGNGTS